MRTGVSRLVRRHRRATTAVAILAVAVGGTGAWAMSRSAPAPAAYALVAAKVSTISQTVTATGTIEPAQEADLTFTVAGTVTSVTAAVGQRVGAGAVLATVTDQSLQTAVAAAQASITAASDQLSADQSTGAAAAQVAAATAQLAAAQSKLAQAQSALAAAQLVSPIAGTVAAVNLATGDVVSGSAKSGLGPAGGASGTTSSAQIVVISTHAFVVDASVGSTDLASVKTGLQALVTPTGSTQPLPAVVSTVGLLASSSASGSATFPVVLTVTGSPPGLYAGGSADVSIVVKQLPNVLTVPTQALHTSGSSTIVYVSHHGTLVATPVTVGASYGPRTQILTGLKAGDEVEVAAHGSAHRGHGSGTHKRSGAGGGSGKSKKGLPSGAPSNGSGGHP